MSKLYEIISLRLSFARLSFRQFCSSIEQMAQKLKTETIAYK